MIYERPKFLPAGDRYLLIEFGNEMNLDLNFMAQGLATAAAAANISGIVETAPCFASLLVHYEPALIGYDDVVREFSRLATSLGPSQDIELESRLFYLPALYLDPWTKEGPRPEYIMYSSDLGKIEKVLGAIASASFAPGYDQHLAGSFDGYHNSAQTEHNDETSEECVYGLGCRVNASEAGFEMRLFNKTATVASIVAKLSSTGVDDVLGIVNGLRQWREGKLREIEGIMKEEPSPAPGI